MADLSGIGAGIPQGSLQLEGLAPFAQPGGGALTGAGNQSPVVGGDKTFSQILRGAVEQVNEYQQQADRAIEEMVAGRDKNIHETLLALERADSSLKLMMQVRNKVLEAYREVMRMQV